MPNSYRPGFNGPQRIDAVWLGKFSGGRVVGLDTSQGAGEARSILHFTLHS